MQNEITATLRNIFQPFKGILAADERPSSMDRRFKEYGIATGDTVRSAYRSMLFTTPNLERTISGVILSEETFLEHTIAGTLTREFLASKGISVGVKLDQGLELWKDSKTLKITAGLEGLDERCQRYQLMGASFAKWRAVVPAIGWNAEWMQDMSAVMSEYACVALRHGMVPVIEPEVLFDGDHTPQQAAETLTETLRYVIEALQRKNCLLSHCILKTSFVMGGSVTAPISAEEVAERTLRVFLSTELEKRNSFYGIVFLSGGLSSEIAIEYMQIIKAIAEKPNTDFYFRKPLSFSYGRALQIPAMQVWNGNNENVTKAQLLFTQTLQNAVKTYRGVETSVGQGGE